MWNQWWLRLCEFQSLFRSMKLVFASKFSTVAVVSIVLGGSILLSHIFHWCWYPIGQLFGIKGSSDHLCKSWGVDHSNCLYPWCPMSHPPRRYAPFRKILSASLSGVVKLIIASAMVCVAYGTRTSVHMSPGHQLQKKTQESLFADHLRNEKVEIFLGGPFCASGKPQSLVFKSRVGCDLWKINIFSQSN